MYRDKVLAVDDSAIVVALLKAQLEMGGFDVTTAASGRQALDAVQRESFDAVILDVEMPEMDGIEVARAFRSDPKTSHLRIAMHTSLPEAEVRAVFAGYDAFLPKPCAPQLLLENVMLLIQQRSLVLPPSSAANPLSF